MCLSPLSRQTSCPCGTDRCQAWASHQATCTCKTRPRAGTRGLVRAGVGYNRRALSRHQAQCTLSAASTAPVWSKLNMTAFSRSSAMVVRWTARTGGNNPVLDRPSSCWVDVRLARCSRRCSRRVPMRLRCGCGAGDVRGAARVCCWKRSGGIIKRGVPAELGPGSRRRVSRLKPSPSASYDVHSPNKPPSRACAVSPCSERGSRLPFEFPLLPIVSERSRSRKPEKEAGNIAMPSSTRELLATLVCPGGGAQGTGRGHNMRRVDV